MWVDRGWGDAALQGGDGVEENGVGVRAAGRVLADPLLRLQGLAPRYQENLHTVGLVIHIIHDQQIVKYKQTDKQF